MRHLKVPAYHCACHSRCTLDARSLARTHSITRALQFAMHPTLPLCSVWTHDVTDNALTLTHPPSSISTHLLLPTSTDHLHTRHSCAICQIHPTYTTLTIHGTGMSNFFFALQPFFSFSIAKGGGTVLNNVHRDPQVIRARARTRVPHKCREAELRLV